MSNSNPVGPMGILGNALIGETLTARPNAIKDADGINYNTRSFQWLRDGKTIYGATEQTYDVTQADAGTQLSVRYSYTDNAGNRETVTSDPEPTVPGTAPTQPAPDPDTTPDYGNDNPNNAAPEGPLGILGEAQVGNTLTARPNSIKDADGINYGSAAYQWLRDGEPISGATSQFYKVSSADRGTELSVQWSYTDKAGTRETILSEPEPTVPGGTTTPPTEPDEPDTPTTPTVPDGHMNSVPVGKLVILGFPIEDTELWARTDAVFDRDGFDASGASFQWLRDGEPITGATGQRYTIQSEDRGAALSVQMSYTDGAGTRETVVSQEEPPVPFPEGQEPPAEDNTPEVLEGTPQADTLVVPQGTTHVDGLSGVDTAVFDGDQTDYTITFSPEGVSVTDRSPNSQGTVTLENIELIDFGQTIPAFDGAMDLSKFGGHTDLDEEDFGNFIEMYISYFNRAPDAIGLSFWATAYADGMSLEEIANHFSNQPETLETYGANTSNIAFASEVYQNVLGRSPDIDGLRFWTKQLDEGNVSRGEFILEVLQGVKAQPPADASPEFIERQNADQQYLEQKVDLGAHFAVHRGMSNVEDAEQIFALFDGTTESLNTAVQAVDTLHNAAMDSLNGDFLMPIIGIFNDPLAT